MKKLSLILMSLVTMGLVACQQEVVEYFEKPTDVVNPNPPTPPTQYEYGLKDLAGKVGLKIGVAMTHDEYFKNDSIAVLLARDFDAVTFGNEMKHDAIVQNSGALKFTTADEMVGWSEAAGVEVFGHNLGWHEQQNVTYLQGLIDNAAADNSASLLQDNWNFEAGSLDGYTADGVEMTTSPREVFTGNYAAKATKADATLSFGAAVEASKPYVVSFWAKGPDGAAVKVETSEGKSDATTVTSSWAKYSTTLKTKSVADYKYTLTLAEGVCVDNIRVEEGEEESSDDDKGGNFINPYTLVEDGGFESATVGALGQLGWSAMNGSDVLSFTDEAAHSGTISLKMDNSADYAGSSSWKIQAAGPTFTIDPTKTYRVAWYAKSSIEEADLQIDTRWAVSSTGYYSTTYSQLGSSKVTGDWQYFWVDLTPGDAGDTSLQVVFYGGCSVATYWIDDFQVFEATNEGDFTNYIDKNNMLGDADFEGSGWGVWNGGDYASIVHRNYTKDEGGNDVLKVDVNKDKVHSALHALVVDNSSAYCSGGDGWKIQVANNNKIAVEESKEYRIGFWAKSPDGYETLQIEGKWDTGTNYWQIGGITSEWTFVYFDKVAPEGATTLQLVLDAGYSTGTVYIDDFQVYPKPIETCIDPSSIVDDGDFESYADADAMVTAGWQINGNSGDTKYTSIVTDAHHGKQAVCMDNTSGVASNAWDIQLVSKNYPCEAGKTYRIAWQGKADAADVDMQIDIREDGSAVAYKNSAWGNYDKMQDSWTYQYYDYTVESGSQIAVGFYGGGSVNKFTIDCFQIFEVAASTDAMRMSKGFGKYGNGWVRPAPNARGSVRPAEFESTDKTLGELAEDRIQYAYKQFVYGMVDHFDVYAWDVMNETFTETGQYRTPENTDPEDHFFWGQYFDSQKDFVEKAFAYTVDALDASGKTADLYINDYNLESSSSKLTAICEFAKNNPNVTGIGTQMHLTANNEKLAEQEAAITNMLKKMVETGKKVRISELDIVIDGGGTEDLQAEVYVYVVDQYLKLVPEAQRGGITIWGFNDKDSWRGESNAPLLWKGNKYEKKAAYESLYLYLKEAAGL